ncbi:unnamed protein product [Hyaloperonospora brassicae]|uniref:START domain-containing protein n=1 Tax=Hyaloperonospora brassicae TaxID=162125 RepID=A0AAV0U1K0_HYABA|nr:unnamed protein product [Hyaloperonospora brassicae]
MDTRPTKSVVVRRVDPVPLPTPHMRSPEASAEADLPTSLRSPKKRRSRPSDPMHRRTPSVPTRVSRAAGRSGKSGRPSTKAPCSATHELRLLRAQVTSMETELHKLQLKWVRDLPDAHLLATAQHSACKKRAVAQTQATQHELQDVLLQEQLVFAALQAAISRAPLHSRGPELLQALHFGTRFGRDAGERRRTLAAHNERSLATIPSIVRRFAQMTLDKVGASRDDTDAAATGPVLPISRMDITGCKDCTLVSSVFVSEIPHDSLEDVYAAAVAYYDSIPTMMKRHFGVEATRTRLNSADAPAEYWQLDLRGVGLPSSVNHILCSDLTSSHGVIHMDAVIDDPLYPASRANDLEFGVSGLTLTPRRELGTNQVVAITLRWIILYRYKLLANDPALRKDLEYQRPILNGDLVTASVCSYLQQLPHRRATSSQRQEQ